MGMSTTQNLNPFGLYARRDGAWHFELSFETAVQAARYLGSLTDGLGQFSPPVEEWTQDIADGFCVQSTDRIGTTHAVLGMPMPATIATSSTIALCFGYQRTEDDHEPLDPTPTAAEMTERQRRVYELAAHGPDAADPFEGLI